MIFQKDYYINSTNSNYKDYRQKKFQQLAKDIIQFVPLYNGDKVLDFGCAIGGLVNEMRANEIDCIGTDISFWAIDQGRKIYNFNQNILQYYNLQLLNQKFDMIMMLDVIQHISDQLIRKMLSIIESNKILIRIPVSVNQGQDYRLQVSRNDKTHIQIHCKEYWLSLFYQYGFKECISLNCKSIYDSQGVLSVLLTR